MNVHYEHAQAERYGFEFGKARVTRVAHVEGRYHVVGLDTPHHHLQLAISPTGRSVRVWIDGAEITLPDSDSRVAREGQGEALGASKARRVEEGS